MKAENNSTEHKRTIKITEIPGEVKELEISISYTGFSDTRKTIALDNVVIPKIIACINEPTSSVQLGTRVKYKDNPNDTGIIVDIVLDTDAFVVKWDNDKYEDTLDQYSGNQLEII